MAKQISNIPQAIQDRLNRTPAERKAQLDKQGIKITSLVSCGSDAPKELSDLPWSRQDMKHAEAMGAVQNARSILD